MARKIKSDQINLIPRSEFESSFLGRVLTWLLTTFRYIVIITEMVVMVAFFSRIWLDAKNADLADELRQKEAVLAATKDFEDDFVASQQKIAILKEAIAKGGATTQALDEIVALTPSDVVLISYSDTEDGIILRASSPTEQAIAQHLVNLESSDLFTAVNLSQIRTGQDSSFLEFTINLERG
jgi:Tfp pilus assembly protein PilN